MMVNFNFAPPVEHHAAVSDISELQNHFTLYYKILEEAKIIPQASFEKFSGLTRCLSGLHMPYTNIVMGVPQDHWEERIQEQIAFFKAHQMPFVWYVDQDASSAFKQKLTEHGFKDTGIFKGVCGSLDAISQQDPNIHVEEVQDDATMCAFNNLVSDTFGFYGEDRAAYKKAMQHHKMRHYVVKKEEQVISCLSTFTEGNIISFWNGATDAQYRKQGLSMALRQYALNARAKNCTLGASFLMAEGMALGICEKLGFTTKWQFHAFVLKE